MAVVVQCYHCNTILELDEGFRGGVCRCSTCGSLLQVPKAATLQAPKARPAAPGASTVEGKRPGGPPGDSGLSRGQFDRQANSGSAVRPAIPDFGGSSSGLRGARPAAPVATAQAPRPAGTPRSSPSRSGPRVERVRKNNVLLVAGIALIAVITIVVAIVLIKIVLQPPEPDRQVRNGRGVPAGGVGSTEPGGTPSPGGNASQEAARGFLGVPLVGKRIVLSIDGASSMTDWFDYVRRATYHAVESLEPGQEIRIALWKGDGVTVLPADFVGKAGLPAIERQLNALAPGGSSNAGRCMKASLALGTDQVIFVTAKYGLEPQIVEDIYQAKVGAVRFDAIKIESVDSPSPLQILAMKSGGTFHQLSTAQVEQLSK